MVYDKKETGFYNREQAIVFAETFYEMGMKEYSCVMDKGTIHDGKIEEVWKLWPAVINLAFACEIMLKIAYEKDNGEIATGHKLKNDLYDKLLQSSQKNICDMVIRYMNDNNYKEYKEEDFLEDLEKSQNTFTNERYAFEMIPGRNHNLQVGFFIGLASVLKTIVTL